MHFTFLIFHTSLFKITLPTYSPDIFHNFSWPSVETRSWTPWSRLLLRVVVSSPTSTSPSSARRTLVRSSRPKRIWTGNRSPFSRAFLTSCHVAQFFIQNSYFWYFRSSLWSCHSCFFVFKSIARPGVNEDPSFFVPLYTFCQNKLLLV